MREEAVVFGSPNSLVGILTQPSGPTAGQALRPAVILLNAGVTHHVGPNRLYVQMARELAAGGFLVLRFDFSGIGDSEVRADNLPPDQSVMIETRAAMDFLEASRGVERFLLAGICSGATVAFLAARADPRVAGAVLINAQGHLHGTDLDVGNDLRGRTVARHSWRIAFSSSFASKNWRKAIRGNLNPWRVARSMLLAPPRLFSRRARAPGFGPDAALAQIRAVTDRSTRLLHLYSEGDEGLDYFHVVLGDRAGEVDGAAGLSRVEVIRRANHVFTLQWSQERLRQVVCDWAREVAGAPTEVAAGRGPLS